MLKNEKTLSNSTFHYLHDNQSIIISFPLRAQISRPHPPPWKIIDKSTFESKQEEEEERFSPSKKKKSLHSKNPRHPPEESSLAESWRTRQIQLSKPGQPLGQPFAGMPPCSWATCSTHVEQKYRWGSEGERETVARAASVGSERDDNSGGVGARDGEELEFLVARSPIARRWGRRAQCYDGQQADKSQPVLPFNVFCRALAGPSIHTSVHPSTRPSVPPVRLLFIRGEECVHARVRACVRACERACVRTRGGKRVSRLIAAN